MSEVGGLVEVEFLAGPTDDGGISVGLDEASQAIEDGIRGGGVVDDEGDGEPGTLMQILERDFIGRNVEAATLMAFVITFPLVFAASTFTSTTRYPTRARHATNTI